MMSCITIGTLNRVSLAAPAYLVLIQSKLTIPDPVVLGILFAAQLKLESQAEAFKKDPAEASAQMLIVILNCLMFCALLKETQKQSGEVATQN